VKKRHGVKPVMSFAKAVTAKRARNETGAELLFDD
jgi:hypothetical protein